ncbi:type II toxin-antitoxin system RelE family toxin [Aphanothece sacrum]|uniref:RelE/StbE family addiction module toxin n=1 Tax=Aphanothece sacrum FPU1 TaxID=1920663 RepID=A0A401INC3_APHSA|nr:type II toxin-antitoxin system RelE/ParE family toxin [Aphanothece sacrum]GBF82742.1 RelE/StbE family addiction module toxin [Aphanothece sacrum FPU1]GBF84467.1 RelE/StbE family addiction module toxin [Aphanothece sacrum FPU3]
MTEYKIEFLKSAKKELSKLPKDIQERIKNKIETLKINPYPPDFKQLTNGEGRLRVRIGDYRIIYRVENNILVVLVIKIGHHSKIYKN